jgi:hypothetical protein
MHHEALFCLATLHHHLHWWWCALGEPGLLTGMALVPWQKTPNILEQLLKHHRYAVLIPERKSGRP